MLAEQFTTLREAAKGCDVIVAGNQSQVATRAVVEVVGAKYLHVARSPISLPSPHHAPSGQRGGEPARCGSSGRNGEMRCGGRH
jgi:vancomycin aglycone glucosyltransferase